MIAGPAALLLFLAAAQSPVFELVPSQSPPQDRSAPAPELVPSRVVRPADAPPPIVIPAPAPDPTVVRPADASPPIMIPAPALGPTLDELKWQLTINMLDQQIKTLHENRPSLIPPLIVWGAGTISVVIGAILASDHPKNEICISSNEVEGAGLVVLGLTVGLVGLIWLSVEATILGNLDRQIENLEAQRAMLFRASERPAVIPWSRGGASGLALSVPLP